MIKKVSAAIVAIALILVFAQMTPQYTSAQETPQTVVKVLPALIEKGPENVTGHTVVVAVVVEKVQGLYGFDIKFKWNTTFLDYVSRNVTVPVESFPSPQPPSPYGGILHTGESGDPITVRDFVNATAGTYHLAMAAMAPAPAFDGNGTFFTMKFVIKYQQRELDGEATFFFDFIDVKLSNENAEPIPHLREKGTFIMHPIPQPERPKLKIVPANYQYRGNMPKTGYLNLSIVNLHPYWDLTGFDVKIAYDARFIKVTDVEAGPFLQQFEMTFEILKVINNAEGYVHVAYSQVLPPEERPIPEGTGVLLTLEINITAPISETTVEIISSKLASFPHPERRESPWRGNPWSVPIPHSVEKAKLCLILERVHVITVGNMQAQIVTESNATISPISYEYLLSHRMIRFTATGFSGFVGYCKVTIPKWLMWGTWVVMVDGQIITPTITEDATNTYLNFTFNFQSSRQITIMSSHVVPEFSQVTVFLAMVILGLAYALVFRKLSKRKP